MIAFIVRRTMLAWLTAFFISMIAFFAIQAAPGDYASIYMQKLIGGEFMTAVDNEAIKQQIRVQYGLDQPQIVQYAKWAWRLLQLDFGASREHGTKISLVIGDKLANTILLALGTILFTWVLAIPIGIYSAVRHNSVGDYTATFFGFLGLSVPDFLLGLCLLWLAFYYFGLSIGGLYSPEYADAAWSFAKFVDLLKHLWIPAIVLGTAGTAGLIRVMRNNLLDELARPYVVAARARGVSEWMLVIKYPVRMALNPFISGIGYLLPALLSGSVIVSMVLGLPTLGPVLLEAMYSEDTGLAGIIVLLMGILTIVGTLFSDILLVAFDPRIRLES